MDVKLEGAKVVTLEEIQPDIKRYEFDFKEGTQINEKINLQGTVPKGEDWHVVVKVITTKKEGGLTRQR